MPGIFQIHPANKATIAFDTLDTIGTSQYLLVSQDMKESEREKILYSEGRFGGSVSEYKASIVTIELKILVNGTSPEDVASNLSVLMVAFANADGGYIEYKPIYYSASTLSTYYRYLKSTPPERLSRDGEVQPMTESFANAGLYHFNIKIFSMATSDPDTLVDIVSGSVSSFEGSNPYLIIPESSFKGEGIMPFISIAEGTSVNPDDILVHFMRLESAGDGEDFYGLSKTSRPGSVSYNSTDRFYTVSAETSWWLMCRLQESTKDLHRKSTPVMPYYLYTTGGDWEVRLTGRQLVGQDQILTEWEPLTPTASSDYWQIHIFDTIDVPPIQFPSVWALASSNQEVNINLREVNSTPGYVKVYGLLLMPQGRDGDWMARFIGSGYSEYLGTYQIDVIDGIHFAGSWPSPSLPWVKQGMPISDAIMPRDRYQMRVMTDGSSGVGDGWFDLGAVSVDVDGIYYTIYPFDEA